MNDGYGTSVAIALVAFVIAAGALYFAIDANSTAWTSRGGESVNLDQLADLGSAIMTETELENKITAAVEKKIIESMDDEEYGRTASVPESDKTFVPKGRFAADPPAIVPEADNTGAVFGLAPTIRLTDASGEGVLSKAWLAVYNGITYHRIAARGLAAPVGTDYYEGWLVRNPDTLDMFSVGKMKYDPGAADATLSVRVTGDQEAYRTVYVTLEKDDGDPMPGKVVLKGTFWPETDLAVTDKMIESYKANEANKAGFSTSSVPKADNSTQSLLEAMLKGGSNNDSSAAGNSDPLASLMQLLQGSKK
ncbi:hypothetical protein A2303_03845 [Candidatus Falkowbacteria bacterium RIFOXYB2_FULL_47_14]|nr:MAG: hypothetical protein A2303_03845 [Candidatus Falkowbacteria bacterium RIFOXYB2_FULL_47_14]